MMVEARDLRVWIPLSGKTVVRAVDGVTLNIAHKQIVGLVGESGSGKSTTGRALLRLVRPTSGTILFETADITFASRGRLRALRPRMQMIFQHPGPALNPRVRVGVSIAEPLDAAGVSRAEARTRADEMLERVGLPAATAQRYPHELSGGQLQRVAIARALIGRPQFVVADEPLSSLDLSMQAQIVALLEDMQREMGLSLLFITHDLAIAEYLSDHIVVMYLGKVMESAPGRGFAQSASHPYTKALLDSVPRLDPIVERARPAPLLPGDAPSAIHPPSGCRFHTRCPLAEERCRVQEPPLRRIADDHEAACWLI
jgi:oligopeptide/dipeptide ABC transporter ATP-binding protein